MGTAWVVTRKRRTRAPGMVLLRAFAGRRRCGYASFRSRRPVTAICACCFRGTQEHPGSAQTLQAAWEGA